ncbi:acid phosphatase-like protein [Hapsidospora chrysogenum ATCC 11550]|uniref:Acid phosphatase-like protein n=1 Tax=Hapsidospora chrysogenum (strain ATCC 11550 / CBS 779.69 / DSM 880 / IAM 14645 / JCM 23072 / IMI 49137) TaxID=857340 RepID=A0A086T377_HAPC1|nr:acid phosphatase-like protein [Hapsidospora chrysogenum ATCC 11550]
MLPLVVVSLRLASLAFSMVCKLQETFPSLLLPTWPARLPRPRAKAGPARLRARLSTASSSSTFENKNYGKALSDPDFKFFAKRGITLSNYFVVTHPSEPNSMAGPP